MHVSYGRQPERRFNPPPRKSSGPRDVVGDGYMAVHGESFKRANLDRLMGHRGRANTTFSVATLRPEPNNPADSNAVLVVIGNEAVGYLPRGLADEFAGAFAEGELLCAAEIRRDNPSHDWNVVLRIDYVKLKELRSAGRTVALRQVLDPVTSAALTYGASRGELDPVEVRMLLEARDQAIVEARSAACRPTLAELANAAAISSTTVGKILKRAESAEV